MTGAGGLARDDEYRHETRTLAFFVTGAATSNAGSFMQNTAVPFVLYRITGSNAWVGAGVFASLAFSVFAGPFAGIAIDRFSQKQVLLVAQVLQTFAALGLLALSMAHVLSPWPIFWLVAFGGIGSGLQFPAAQSFTPTILRPERIPRGVRLTTFGLTISRTIGPAVAAIVLTASGPDALFALNAATFVVYIAILVFIRPRPTPHSTMPAGMVRQYREAWAYVRVRTGVLSVLWIGFVGSVFGTSIAFLVPGIAARYGAGGGGVGTLLAFYGAGAILGSLVLISAGVRMPRGLATRLGYLGYGIGGILAVQAAHFGLCIVAFVIMGIGYSLWLTSLGTSLQVQITDAFRGRVTALYIVAIVGGAPFGALIGGWLGDSIGLSPVLTVYGIVMLVLAAVGGFVLHFGRLDSIEIDHRPGGDR